MPAGGFVGVTEQVCAGEGDLNLGPGQSGGSDSVRPQQKCIPRALEKDRTCYGDLWVHSEV